MIALGHPPEAVWEYTPRQSMAFLLLARKRMKRDQAEGLSLARLAAHGSAEDLRDAMRKLTR